MLYWSNNGIITVVATQALHPNASFKTSPPPHGTPLDTANSAVHENSVRLLATQRLGQVLGGGRGLTELD